MAASAPSKDMSRELKTQLKRAMRKDMDFFYCAADEDGSPHLIIDRQVKSASAKIRKSAKVKQFANGKVTSLLSRDPHFVVFASSAPKLLRHLHTYFGKGVPQLKKAKLISKEEWEAELKALQEPLEEDAPKKEAEADKQTQESKPDDDSLPDFDADPDELDRFAAELPWGSKRVLKNATKFSKAQVKYNNAKAGGGSGKKEEESMLTALDRLDRMMDELIRSATDYKRHITVGRVDAATAKPFLKNMRKAYKLIRGSHKSLTHDHGFGYPNKTMKRLGRSSGERLMEAIKALK